MHCVSSIRYSGTFWEVPMEARAPELSEDAAKLDEAKKQLHALGFDQAAIERATNGLKPRLTHKTQIRKIVARLGLDPDGDIAKQWTSLCDSFGKAHQRSFHHSLKVDEEFRSQYQQPSIPCSAPLRLLWRAVTRH